MKRFNYTGRKKILREDVKVRLNGDFHDKPIVDVSINLNDYQLPSESVVYIEAQWKTRHARRLLGNALNSVRKNAIPLDEFDDAEGLDFRVKIVEEPRGLLLAIAENIKPYDKDDKPDKRQKSILPVSSSDLSNHGVLWRIQYVDQQVTLQVEQELGSKEQVVRSLLFRGFILPAAMRQILAKIMSDDWNEELDDPDELSTRWILFAQQLGAGLPDKNAEDNEEWIDNAVRLIGNNIGVRQKIIDEFDSGAWK